MGGRCPTRQVRAPPRWPPAGSPLEADQLGGAADEAVPAARQRCREDLVAEVARVVPVEMMPQVCGLCSGTGARRRARASPASSRVRVMRAFDSQKKSGDVSSPDPSSSVTASYWTPVAAGQQQHGRCPSLPRVENHAAVVGEFVPLMWSWSAIGERMPRGSGILELKRRVEKPVVEGEVADTLHARRRVVSRVGFVPDCLHLRGRLPGRLRQVAVDRDRALRPCDVQRLSGRRGLRDRGRSTGAGPGHHGSQRNWNDGPVRPDHKALDGRVRAAVLIEYVTEVLMTARRDPGT